MNNPNPPPNIASQFIRVQHRDVLLRYAGRGPALLLLHQSPQNSRALTPWIARLSTNYAVFAPDTPGFGYSDPLPMTAPEIADYAAAIAALVDALGIGKVLVYGVHTGAVTAMRLALDFPEKIAGLVCDGYARFNNTEREAILANYLPPFEPTWDGGHLMWLFARLHEQHLFFPWHEPTLTARLQYPVPSPERVHSDVMDVLDAGDGYRVGYRAPFLYDDATAAARLAVPTRIYYRTEDVLSPHLLRLPVLPSHVTAEIVEGGPAALAVKADAAFAAFSPDATVCATDQCVAFALAASISTRFFVATSHGPIVLRSIAGCGEHDLLLLHELGQPARTVVTSDQYRRVIIIDLPGHGASRDWPVAQCDPKSIAEAMMVALNVAEVDLIGIEVDGGSAAIAVALAQRLGPRCLGITLIRPLALSPTERNAFMALLPAAVPLPGGGHLAAVWQWARLKYLFWPWLPPTGNAARKTAAPAPRRVHADVVEVLRAGPRFEALWRHSLAFDLTSALATLTCPITIRSSLETEPRRMSASLAEALGMTAAPSPPGELIWVRGA